MPVWMTGVDRRGMVSSRGATKSALGVCNVSLYGPITAEGNDLRRTVVVTKESLELSLARVQASRNASDNVRASIKSGSLLPLLCLAR